MSMTRTIRRGIAFSNLSKEKRNEIRINAWKFLKAKAEKHDLYFNEPFPQPVTATGRKYIGHKHWKHAMERAELKRQREEAAKIQAEAVKRGKKLTARGLLNELKKAFTRRTPVKREKST